MEDVPPVGTKILRLQHKRQLLVDVIIVVFCVAAEGAKKILVGEKILESCEK